MARARPKSRTAPPRRRRRPGRPAGSASQRERLLDAALAYYAHNGMANAKLRAIALAAAVTPALIGYHFGGRDALLRAVIEERVMPAIADLRASIATAGDDASTLATAFVRPAHALVRAHPWLPSLWVREVLTEGGMLRPILLERIAPLIPRALAARFDAARRQRRLDPALDPRLLVVSIVGLTLFPLAAESIWRKAFDAGDIDDEVLQAHTLALLRKALEAPDAH